MVVQCTRILSCGIFEVLLAFVLISVMFLSDGSSRLCFWVEVLCNSPIVFFLG